MNFRQMVLSSSALGACGIILVVLKFMGIVNASWVLVLMPFWTPLALLVPAVLGYTMVLWWGIWTDWVD